MSHTHAGRLPGDLQPEEHRAEAERRWGHTEAYKESARRTAGYTEADLRTIKAETDEIHRAAAALMGAGKPPTDEAAMDVAERARLQVDRCFYPCSRGRHRALAEMYGTDARFEATYERIAPGLAAWWRAAIRANGDRAADDPR